jgi:hypothetical protein
MQAGPEGLALHFEGACGEMAFAKATNRYWSGSVDTFRLADIGTAIQVRTRSNHSWDLLVRPSDADDDLFVLVTGWAPDYQVHGWIAGAAAKRPEWLKEYGGRPPAYFVPKDKLKSLGSLASLERESLPPGMAA